MEPRVLTLAAAQQSLIGGTLGFLLLGCKGDITNAAFAAIVDDVDNILILGFGIPSDSDRLVRIDGGETLHFLVQLLETVGLTFHHDGAIATDIDNFLKVAAGFGGSFFGGGHADIQLGFIVRELVGDDEKDEKEEDNINHRRKLEARWWCLAVLKFHGLVARMGCLFVCGLL